jgi:cation-transporting P-type ATPase E
MTQIQGLSLKEVKAKQLAGESNNAKLPTSRSYTQIFRENLFTFVNAVFFAISVIFLVLRRPTDAIFVASIVFSGVVIGIVQEISAKQKLEKIALLTRPVATVVRDGKEHTIEPTEIVLGDILILRPGDQILVDGEVIGEGKIEVDESLLTGESDLIPKVASKPVYSGSFCVSGSVCYEAKKVGVDTIAYQLMVGAREFRQVYTPLQMEINLIIRVFLLIACFLWILITISFFIRSQSLNEIIQRAAVIAGLIPAGLLIAITISYVTGAVRMFGENILIQQTNALESLSNVDVLCLDKTGTLTSNQLNLQEIIPIDICESDLRSKLGNYAATTKGGNKTNEAILLGCPGYQKPTVTEVAFSSDRKWSLITFDDEKHPETYILSAPEKLLGKVQLDAKNYDYIQQKIEAGLRVLLFASTPDAINEDIDIPQLPENIIPLGILVFNDQLRTGVRETLQGFVKAGITLKIISGDNPKTVAAIASQAGFSDEIKIISGAELAEMDEAQFNSAAKNYNVFGRVTPQQKAQLVKSLRDAGHYVAMTGDGVNDVLSLKMANLGIAMESGSNATRGIADIVLLKDSFDTLPNTFLEGQRIRNGIRDVMKLFMVRLSCISLLIFATAIVTDSFPLMNKHSAIVTLIGVGLPTTFIPIWAQPGEQPKRSMIRSILNFILPATITITLVALMVYLYYLIDAIIDLPPSSRMYQVSYDSPRTALVTILVFCELLLIPFLKPPTTAWVASEPLSGDWRYTILSGALIVVYLFILYIPPIREFFELAPLSPINCLWLGLIALEWCLIIRLIWRSKFLDRFLGVDLD